jgi:hypothetical protein
MKLDALLINTRRKQRTWNLHILVGIKFRKYWDKLLSLVFNYSSRCYCRASPLHIEKLKNPCISLKYFSDHFGSFSTSRTLIGKVSADPEDLSLTQHLLKIVFEQVKLPKLCELVTAEILSKVLAYRVLQENTRLYIPTITQEKCVELIEYTVDMVFDLWNQHVAFGLLPKNSPSCSPILLFRGTDFSLLSSAGRASVLSDLDPDGPGRRLFHNSRSNIHQWLTQIAYLGKKSRVMGHSLGGILALYTSIYEHSFLSNDPHVISYAFNPPGVHEDLLDEWNALAKEEKPSFKTIITRGDIVSKFGLLLDNTYETFSHKPLSPMVAHEQLIFSQPISYLAQIDHAKENTTNSRAYYSKIQKQSTSLAYRFGLKYLFPNPF